MNIEKVRQKSGLNKREFIEKLKPELDRKGTILTENMLSDMEGGKSLDKNRSRLIFESVEEVFPSANKGWFRNISVKNSIRKKSRFVTLVIFLLSSVGFCILYFYSDEKKLIMEMLGIVAAVAGIIALVGTLSVSNK